MSQWTPVDLSYVYILLLIGIYISFQLNIKIFLLTNRRLYFTWALPLSARVALEYWSGCLILISGIQNML